MIPQCIPRTYTVTIAYFKLRQARLLWNPRQSGFQHDAIEGERQQLPVKVIEAVFGADGLAGLAL